MEEDLEFTSRVLPEDVLTLQKLVMERDQEIERLREMLVLMKRRMFAPKSEKLPAIEDDGQKGFFNEAEILSAEGADPDEMDAESEDTVVEDQPTQNSTSPGEAIKKPKRGGRKPLPENLPRERVVIELPESERICPHDGKLMDKIGEEISEKLDVIPMQAKVIQTVRCKYGCTHCEGSIKTAPVQPQALPKAIASEGLLAAIATWKYADCLPLYRIEAMFKRIGVSMSRTSLAHWMIKSGELLIPLINLLEEDCLSSRYIQMDETRVQVLKEKVKRAQSLSYMWVRAKPGKDPIILFEYDPTREGSVPVKLLKGFEGTLQVDGYEGYNAITAHPEVMRLGCMAHCRRRFFEASKASKKAGVANRGLKYIQKLYRIEDECEGKTEAERYAIRQAKSRPLLDELKKWIDEVLPKVPPKTLVGKALHYANNQWVNLVRYIDDGKYEIDNNFIENEIRPFALGRKNWLFSDSVDGAKASAAIYSLVVTARANGMDPYRYLRFVFEKLPRAKTLEDIEALLPRKAKITLQTM